MNWTAKGSRCALQSRCPEIDGTVFLRDVPESVKLGDVIKIKVEDADDYDLYGVPAELA